MFILFICSNISHPKTFFQSNWYNRVTIQSTPKTSALDLSPHISLGDTHYPSIAVSKAIMKAGLINPYVKVRCTREFAPWPSTEILKVQVKFHSSLTSALNGDEWPPSGQDT